MEYLIYFMLRYIKHLKKAKALGDKLVVTLTADNFVNKGPGKPIFNQKLRAEAIASLEMVDFVAVNDYFQQQ